VTRNAGDPNDAQDGVARNGKGAMPERSPSSRARVPAAKRSSCTSKRRQSAGSRRSRRLGRDLARRG
jgi:hypothetical protein